MHTNRVDTCGKPTSVSNDLLCCPFCGGEAFVWEMLGKMWKVSCTKDCVSMPPRFDMGFTSEEGARKNWNHRAT